MKTLWRTVLLFGLLVPGSSLFAQGLALYGIGPINQSMGGAAVAAPLDASGAIHWNPASISGLERPEMSFGVTLAVPSERLSSSIAEPFPLAGSTRGDPGASPIPYAAFVYREAGSRLTYGLGVSGVGGFSSNYPASSNNPVLTPPPPTGLGAGRLAARAELLQVVPTVSWACSESLAVGIAPTLSLGRISADPLFLAAPDDANGDGFATYPSGTDTRYHWGGGFQIGAYLIGEHHWHYGASLKSPQWFETFRFPTEDELGRPRDVRLRLQYPLIVSVGTAYSGFEDVILAGDIRYFDYARADGLGPSGFRDDGSVRGLGWESIFALGLGAQWSVTESLALRIGYAFNENPVPDDQSSTNAGSPVITQHYINVGASARIGQRWLYSATYTHGFENQISGPIQTPSGAVPGSDVTSEVSLNGFTMGVSLWY